MGVCLPFGSWSWSHDFGVLGSSPMLAFLLSGEPVWAPPHSPKSSLPVFPGSPALSPRSWTALLSLQHPNSAQPSAHLPRPNRPGNLLRPTLIPEPSPVAAPASLSASLSSPGKKHILVLSELRPEDAGEVRFQAGPAQSVAQLEVEGKQLGRDGWEWASSTPRDWQAGGGSWERCLPTSLPHGWLSVTFCSLASKPLLSGGPDP